MIEPTVLNLIFVVYVLGSFLMTYFLFKVKDFIKGILPVYIIEAKLNRTLIFCGVVWPFLLTYFLGALVVGLLKRI